MIRISNISQGVQEEGCQRGVPATFLHFKIDGEEMPLDALLGGIHMHYVVCTGEEPFDQDVQPLINVLQHANKAVQIETFGMGTYELTTRTPFITWTPVERNEYSCTEQIARWCDEIKFIVDEAMSYDIMLQALRDVREVRTSSMPFLVFVADGTEMLEKAMSMALEAGKTMWVRFSVRYKKE